jgi:drug/metabolite transporter (DMT)-like permease
MNHYSRPPCNQQVFRNSLLAVATFGLFSLFSTFVRLSREEVEVVTVLFTRFTVGTLIIILWILRKHSWKNLLPSQNLWLISCRVLCSWLSFSVFTYVASRLSVSDVIALQFSIPLLLAIAARYLLGEELPLLRKIAIVVGFLGILLVSHPGGRKEPYIIALALIACIFATASDICVKILSHKISPELIALYFFVGGAILSTIWLCNEPQPIPSLHAAMCLFGIAVTGVIAQVLLGIVFSRMPASAVAPFAYTSYVWSLLFDCAIWGIYPDFLGTLGAICIMADGALAYWSLKGGRSEKDLHDPNQDYSRSTPPERLRY